MKLALSLIALLLATLLCQSQEIPVNNTVINDVKTQPFNPNGIRLTTYPGIHELTLEFEMQVSNLRMEIIDVKGNIMLKDTSEQTFLEKINISAFPQGVYFIRIYSEVVEDFLRFVKI